jgi:hypothetical protein
MDISEPSGMAAAVEWQRRHLSTLKEGATWVIPRSGTILRVSHEAKTITCLISLLPDPSLELVTKAMGWKFINS